MSADLRRWKREGRLKRTLQQVKPMDAMRAVGADGFEAVFTEVHALAEHRRLQRQSLERLLSLPENTYAKDPLRSDLEDLIIQATRADEIDPGDLAAYSQISRSWRVAVRAWLVSAAARPFWHRVCVAMTARAIHWP